MNMDDFLKTIYEYDNLRKPESLCVILGASLKKNDSNEDSVSQSGEMEFEIYKKFGPVAFKTFM